MTNTLILIGTLSLAFAALCALSDWAVPAWSLCGVAAGSSPRAAPRHWLHG